MGQAFEVRVKPLDHGRQVGGFGNDVVAGQAADGQRRRGDERTVPGVDVEQAIGVLTVELFEEGVASAVGQAEVGEQDAGRAASGRSQRQCGRRDRRDGEAAGF